MKSLLLRDKNGMPITFPRIHGNTKVRNIITGKKDRNMSQWRRQAKESAERLIKAFSNDTDVI